MGSNDLRFKGAGIGNKKPHDFHRAVFVFVCLELRLRALCLDLHQRFILHIHFTLAGTAAYCRLWRIVGGYIHYRTEFTRIGLDLNQTFAVTWSYRR